MCGKEGIIMKKRTTPSTREEFVARQEKRKAEKRENIKIFFELLSFFGVSFISVWLLSAIAMIS